MATPQGIFPTGMVLITCSFFVSTTLTSLDGPFAVYSLLPSGVSAMPQGRCPTLTDPMILLVAGSITRTVPPRPVATYTRSPSGETRTPIGFASLGNVIVATTWLLATSMTETVPPTSAVA
jgi:hypothetical protein